MVFYSYLGSQFTNQDRGDSIKEPVSTIHLTPVKDNTGGILTVKKWSKREIPYYDKDLSWFNLHVLVHFIIEIFHPK